MPRRPYFSFAKPIRLLATVTFTLAFFATVHADPVTVTGTATVTNGGNLARRLSLISQDRTSQQMSLTEAASTGLCILASGLAAGPLEH